MRNVGVAIVRVLFLVGVENILEHQDSLFRPWKSNERVKPS